MIKKEKIVIYQIFTRLFGNKKDTNKINGSHKENGSGKFSAFSDKALDEIKKMGFTHVWYTGIIEHATKTDYSQYNISKDHPAIVKGNAGSPYAIKDYYDVDPDLAEDVNNRMNEFEELVTRTHNAGLKIIIDFVPNHVARQYHSDAKPKKEKDLGENDNTHTTFDINNNFYYIPGQIFSPDFGLTVDGITYLEEPAKASGNNVFHAHPNTNDWYETIKLNYGCDYLNGGHGHFSPIPNTWHKILNILKFWADKKIDGFRCDMAEMVPVEFWHWAIPQIKEYFPEIIFIAEIYNPDQYRNYIINGKFDYLYDKVGLYDTLREITCKQKSASALTYCWQSIEGIQQNMLNFLENHDEQRIASDFFIGDPWKAIPAMIITATLNTNPIMVYFGQELGEKGMDNEGFSGKDGRTTIFDYWNVTSISNWINNGNFNEEKLTADQKKLRKFYTGLLSLCNKEKAISNGIFYDLMYLNYQNPQFNPEKQYAYIRQYNNEMLLIVVNFDDKDIDTGIFISEQAFDFLNFDPASTGIGIDLLSGEKIKSGLKKNCNLSLRLNAYSGRIIKYQKKK